MNESEDMQEKIEFDNLSFLRLKPTVSFNPDILDQYDAVVIEYSDHHIVLDIIKNIHAHNEKGVYITPVFLLNIAGNLDDTVVALADGVITNLTSLDSAAAVTRKIQSRM